MAETRGAADALLLDAYCSNGEVVTASLGLQSCRRPPGRDCLWAKALSPTLRLVVSCVRLESILSKRSAMLAELAPRD